MDWFLGLLQGIFGTVIYDLLFASLVAGLLAYLKAKKENLAGPALYGLSGFTLVMLIATTLTGHGLLSKQQPETTSENIEANIKIWADQLGLSIQTQSNTGDLFTLEVGLRSGRTVTIRREKSPENYIEFESFVAVDTERQAFIANLPLDQSEKITDQVDLELARTGLGYILPSPFKGVALQKSVVISSSFNQDTLESCLGAMDDGMVIAREAIRLATANAKFTAHPPAPQ